MTATAPISRPSLHQDLVARLRTMIVENEMAPGERISERALCERFLVSRTPLREALKVLATEGYVRLTPNRGASAVALTLQDLEEAFPVIGALEALAGELAARHATDHQIALVLGLHASMRHAYEDEDRQSYFALNEQIHLAIAEAVRQRHAVPDATEPDASVRRGRYQAKIGRARWAEAMAEHDEIAAALEVRDGERLGRVLRRHLRNKLATLREQFRQDCADGEGADLTQPWSRSASG